MVKSWFQSVVTETEAMSERRFLLACVAEGIGWLLVSASVFLFLVWMDSLPLGKQPIVFMIWGMGVPLMIFTISVPLERRVPAAVEHTGLLCHGSFVLGYMIVESISTGFRYW